MVEADLSLVLAAELLFACRESTVLEFGDFDRFLAFVGADQRAKDEFQESALAGCIHDDLRPSVFPAELAFKCIRPSWTVD